MGKKFEPESLPEDVANAQLELERAEKYAKPVAARPLFERTMMRCRSCKRWVSVGPSQSRTCPGCAADGKTAVLEPVDMAAHMSTLPMKQDAPEELQKLQQQKAAKTPAAK